MKRLALCCFGRRWLGRFFLSGCIALLAGGSLAGGEDLLKKITAASTVTVSSEKEPWRYFLFLPKGYEDEGGREWPLILWLHGRSLRGDDLEQLRRYGPPSFLKNRPDFPFVVICPQLPDGGWPPKDLNGLLDECLKEYRIDEDRVILTGDSLGAMGAWGFAGAYPDRFAALSPITAHGPAHVAERLTKLPIRAWHGDEDEAVPMDEHVALVQKIQELGGDAEIKIIEGGTHVSVIGMNWRDPEWLSWIENQNRARNE